MFICSGDLKNELAWVQVRDSDTFSLSKLHVRCKILGNVGECKSSDLRLGSSSGSNCNIRM